MAKVKYSKYDVYDFLDSKKAEILEKKQTICLVSTKRESLGRRL